MIRTFLIAASLLAFANPWSATAALQLAGSSPSGSSATHAMDPAVVVYSSEEKYVSGHYASGGEQLGIRLLLSKNGNQICIESYEVYNDEVGGGGKPAASVCFSISSTASFYAENPFDDPNNPDDDNLEVTVSGGTWGDAFAQPLSFGLVVDLY